MTTLELELELEFLEDLHIKTRKQLLLLWFEYYKKECQKFNLSPKYYSDTVGLWSMSEEFFHKIHELSLLSNPDDDVNNNDRLSR
jgi:hypothetical protein